MEQLRTKYRPQGLKIMPPSGTRLRSKMLSRAQAMRFLFELDCLVPELKNRQKRTMIAVHGIGRRGPFACVHETSAQPTPPRIRPIGIIKAARGRAGASSRSPKAMTAVQCDANCGQPAEQQGHGNQADLWEIAWFKIYDPFSRLEGLAARLKAILRPLRSLASSLSS